STITRPIGFAARITSGVRGGRIPTCVQILILSRLPCTNSPRMVSASASPYDGATSNHVIPASYARASALRPSRRPTREPREAHPIPIADLAVRCITISVPEDDWQTAYFLLNVKPHA